MASEVDICNSALIKLGDENTISALGEDGREGETCELMYPLVRDRLLAAHPWNFAIGRSTLTKDTTNPAFEYTSQYHLPGDFFRAIKLYDSDERWKIETNTAGEKRLVTDEAAAKLIYIRKITDTAQFSPLFVETLSTILAAEMAEVITGSTQKARKLFEEGELKLREAKRRDGQEGTPDSIEAEVYTSTKFTKQWW